MYYNWTTWTDWTDFDLDTKGYLTCYSGCEKRNIFSRFNCGAGCGCPKDSVKHPLIATKCIKPEECPPLGRLILDVRK